MSFVVSIKKLEVVNATPGIHYQDITYRVLFQMRSSVATNVIAANNWLATSGFGLVENGKLPWNLVYYGGGYALLENYTIRPLDDKSDVIFEGVATYVQKGSAAATRIRFGQNTYEVAVWKALNEDGDEVPVLNSAGSHFIEPLIETEKRQVIYIDKSYTAADMNPKKIREYYNSVNQNPIKIADMPVPARGALMKSISPAIRILTGSTYDWRISFEIELANENENYDRQVLDQGFYYLEALSGEEEDFDGMIVRDGVRYRKIKIQTLNKDTGEYEYPSEPVLLDGEGARLEDTTPGNEKYITFRSKPERDWEELSLPETIWETL